MSASRALVIAGAQRSASTSLAEMLGRHPLVAMAPREVVGLEDPYYPAGLPAVLRHVCNAERSGRVPGMKRPELLHRPEGAERVALHLPGAVVVVSLREPVARTVSAYHHFVRHGILPDLGPEDGLRRLVRRREVGCRWEAGDQVLAHSFYAAGLRRLLGRADLGTVVCLHDEVVQDARPLAGEVQSRLGLPLADLGPLPRANAAPPRDRLGLERVANRICYVMDREAETVAVTSSAWRRGTGKALRTISAKLPARPPETGPLSDELRWRLADLFADDLVEVERLLGRAAPPAWRQAWAGCVAS